MVRIKRKQYFLKSASTKERGQMIVALMISLILFTSGVMLWNYQDQLSKKSPSAKYNADALSIAETVSTRIKALLMRPENYSGTGGGGGSPCMDFSSFRNLSQTSPELEVTDSSTSNPNADATAGWRVKCILSEDEAQKLESSNPLTVAVRSVGSPDIQNLMRTVRLEVTANPMQVQGVLTSAQVVKHSYNMRVAMPNDFNVILTSAGTTAATNLTTSTYALLDFQGAVLHAYNATGNVNLDAIVDWSVATNPALDVGVNFSNIFFIRNKDISLQTMPGSYNPTTVFYAFKKGVETGVLNYSSTTGANFKMSPPFDHVGDVIYKANWNIDLYYNGYRIAYPTPKPPVGSQSCYNYVTGVCNGAYDIAAGSVNSFPAPLPGPDPHLTDLADTCRNEDPTASSGGRLFVFNKSDSDITIDFSKNPVGGSYRNIFCGLVVANTIHIKTDITGANDYAMIGNFIANRIEVMAGGKPNAKIYFINPKDTKPIPASIALPDGVSLQTIFQTFVNHATNIARPFFIPLLMNSAAIPSGDPKEQFLLKSPFDTNWGYMQVSPDDATKYVWKSTDPTLDYNCLFTDSGTCGPSYKPSLSEEIGWLVEEIL